MWPRGLQHARLPCPSLSPRVSYTLNLSVQSLSRVRRFATPQIAARQASLSVTNSNSPVGFLCLCVYFRFVNKFICTSFLFSTHKHYHVTLVFLSGGLHVVSTSSLPGQTTFRISFPGLDSFKGPCVLLLMSSIRNLDWVTGVLNTIQVFSAFPVEETRKCTLTLTCADTYTYKDFMCNHTHAHTDKQEFILTYLNVNTVLTATENEKFTKPGEQRSWEQVQSPNVNYCEGGSRELSNPRASVNFFIVCPKYFWHASCVNDADLLSTKYWEIPRDGRQRQKLDKKCKRGQGWGDQINFLREKNIMHGDRFVIIQISNHYVVHLEPTQCCGSIVLQLKKNCVKMSKTNVRLRKGKGIKG